MNHCSLISCFNIDNNNENDEYGLSDLFFNDSESLTKIDESNFTLDNAIPLLNKFNKFAEYHQLPYNLSDEIRQVEINMKQRVDRSKFSGFPFMQDRTKQNVYTLVWSARERLFKEFREKQEIDASFDNILWPENDVLESWKSIVTTTDTSLFLFPRVLDGVDVNSYAFEPNQRQVLKCRGKPSLLHDDWCLLNKREIVNFMESMKNNSMNIISDIDDTSNDGCTILTDDSDSDLELDPK